MGLEKLWKYRPAAVATDFYKEKNETAAKGALEKLVDTLELGEDGSTLLKAIRKVDKGNELLAGTFAPEYQNVLMNAKLGELFEFYSDYFREYIEGDSYAEAVRIFDKYVNEKYQDILDKVVEAQEILASKRPNLTEEDKQEAKDTLKEYQRIVKALQDYEQLEKEKIAGPVGRDAMKKDHTEMFKPEKET